MLTKGKWSYYLLSFLFDWSGTVLGGSLVSLERARYLPMYKLLTLVYYIKRTLQFNLVDVFYVQILS